METIIAIDPSINFTGWCIACDKEQIASGVIKADKYNTDAEKLFFLHEKMCSILAWEFANSLSVHNIDITTAIVEVPESFVYGRSAGRYGKQLNVQSLFKLSRAIGVILLTVKQYDLECIEVGATKWKGNMNKNVARLVAGEKNHNIADAKMLAQYYFRMKKGGIKI